MNLLLIILQVGGGASIGIELATGRPVDIAINHNADARTRRIKIGARISQRLYKGE